MNCMNGLFLCEKCGHPLDRKANTTVRRAIVWLRGQGRTVNSVVEEEFRYAHEFCLKPGKDDDPTLW